MAKKKDHERAMSLLDELKSFFTGGKKAASKRSAKRTTKAAATAEGARPATKKFGRRKALKTAKKAKKSKR